MLSSSALRDRVAGREGDRQPLLHNASRLVSGFLKGFRLAWLGEADGVELCITSFAANRLDLKPEKCPQQRTGVTSRERVTDIPKGEWLAS